MGGRSSSGVGYGTVNIDDVFKLADFGLDYEADTMSFDERFERQEGYLNWIMQDLTPEDFGELYQTRLLSLGAYPVGYTYRWEGGPYIVTHPKMIKTASDWQAEVGEDEINVGPYRLVLEKAPHHMDGADPLNLRWLYRRDDEGQWLRNIRWKAQKLAILTYRRLMLALAVWGKAYIPYGNRPGWKHAPLLRKIGSWLT